MQKKKLFGALALLIVFVVLMISVSYAWLTLSRVPEVSGVNTYIGANGNLEIALLTGETFADPSKIRSGVGNSAVVQDSTVSNLTWGNVVDLSDESYGLDKISLYPSRLNVTIGELYNLVSSNMLVVPKFGTDGRTVEFVDNTLSAAYTGENQFVYHTASQSYGVRGIGTLSGSSMTAQQSSLAGARTLVKSYRTAATSSCESTWTANGSALLHLLFEHYIDGKTRYTDSDVAVLRDTAARAQGSVGYIDSALRQGVIGIAASLVEDVDTFSTIRKSVENTAFPLSTILKMFPVTLPSNFLDWVTSVEQQNAILKRLIIACDSLSGNDYDWTQIYPLISELIDADKTYFGENKISSLNADTQINVFNTVTLSKDSGVFSLVADFCGNYFVIFDYAQNVGFEIKSASDSLIPNLTQVSTTLDNCEAATGNNQILDANLEDLYGYAVDIACRCNTESSLKLQTTPVLRTQEEAQNPVTQGEGSYMQFSSKQLDDDKMVRMMDALRVGFLDNQNRLLAVAKLNTANYEQVSDGIKAPLYLYEYTMSSGGSISIGARRTDDSYIMSLEKGEATILTAVVWLDGDYVDNSVAASTLFGSMTGSLNLQFSTDVELQSAGASIEPTN